MKVDPFHREKEISGHNGAVYSISADDTYIYSGSADRFVARWKTLEGVQDNFTIRLEHPVYSTCLADNFLFIGLNNGDLHIVDVFERKEVKFYQQHKVGIFEIAHNRELGHVYVADADGNLSVWKLDTLELIIYLPLDCGKIRNISVSPDGTRFALGGQDGICRIFNAKNFNEESSWLAHKSGVTGVLLQTDYVITGGKDALLTLWDLKGSIIKNPIPAHNFGVYRILKFNDLIITASRDKTIKVWNKDLEFIQRLDFKDGGHRHSVNELVYIDEHRFASCGDDGKIILWSLGQSV